MTCVLVAAPEEGALVAGIGVDRAAVVGSILVVVASVVVAIVAVADIACSGPVVVA